MTMQTDVKAKHVSATGVGVNYRTRLKGAVVSPQASATANMAFLDNLAQTGTYTRSTTTVTATITAHGLTTGDRVWLTFTTGGALSGMYVVTVTNDNTFTVTTVASGTITTSNISLYANVLAEIDTYNATAFSVVIPGEGVLAYDGIYVGLPANVVTTFFYG